MKFFSFKLLLGLLILSLLVSCVANKLPENEISIIEKDGFRYITSNGIPDHETGMFPNQHDPVAISEQDVKLRVPIIPTELDNPMNTNGYDVGIAINGIEFDPNGPFYIHDNEMRAIRNPFEGIKSGWQYEGLSDNVNLGHDHNNAHVQPPGVYHYHGVPTLLIEKLQKEQSSEMVLLGYAADGFPIYNNRVPSDSNNFNSPYKTIKSSYRLKQGERPANPSNLPQGPTGNYDGTFVQDYEYIDSLSELDMCNGQHGVTKEYPNGTYYYVITEDWPYIPRYFKGMPDASFKHGPKQNQEERKGEGNVSTAELIDKMDSNQDGKISKSEAKGPLANDFSKVDTNNDGYITKDELDEAPKRLEGGSYPQGGKPPRN